MTVVFNNGQQDGHHRDINGRILIHPKSDAVYLLAYPRSGSNWFRYCFEFITKKTANLSFYSSIVSKEFLLEMDKRIKENSELFNKYLSHYEKVHV